MRTASELNDALTILEILLAASVCHHKAGLYEAAEIKLITAQNFYLRTVLEWVLEQDTIRAKEFSDLLRQKESLTAGQLEAAAEIRAIYIKEGII